MNNKMISLGVTVAIGMALSGLTPAAIVDNLSINGFGSVVAGISEENTFRNVPYDDEINFTEESKLAVQIIADMTEGLSATVQVIGRGSESFDPKFEWAYLSYELTDSTTIRAGRLRAPFYRYSDFLDVGFAYPFIRPPKSMYSLQFSTYDGISLLHTTSLGGVDINANLVAGNVDDNFFDSTEPTDGELSPTYGFNIQFSKDFLTLYTAYLYTKVDIPLGSLETAADGLEAAGAPTSATDKLRIEDDTGTFLGLGVTVDWNDLLINTEYSTVEVDDSLTLTSKNWYFMVGYRINDMLPYLMYEHTENDRNTSTANAFPAPFRPTVQAAFDGQRFEYSGITLGLRYDFHPTASFKMEYNAYDDIVDITSGFGNEDDKESLNVFSVGIDFVF